MATYQLIAACDGTIERTPQMPETTISLPAFTKRDVMNLAFAVSSSATAAYLEERMTVAATEHALAARLWAALGHDKHAHKHRMLSHAITQEAIAIASGDEDDAKHLGDTNLAAELEG